MARVTVEDCLDFMTNRFELVLVASKRARQISNGSQPFVPLENDKPTVLALREIAEQHVTARILDEDPQADVRLAVEQVRHTMIDEQPQG